MHNGEDTMDENKLANQCSMLLKSTSDAQEWVADTANSDRVGHSRHAITKNLNRLNRRVKKLERAIDRNTSVAVFGPSQAGKSFLVSVLARPKDGILEADFEDECLNYISKINPEGEGESTGLVTRFTMNKTNCPEGYPVKLLILSEADIVRILCNSFYMDGDQSEQSIEAEELNEHITRFREKQGSSPSKFNSDQVFEIQEYIEHRFSKLAYTVSLKSFWDEAASIAPNLNRNDSCEFFSILWGQYEPITSLFARLTQTLDMLDHSEYLFAKTDALVPKDQSIIDVKTLQGLYSDAKPLKVEVQTTDEKVVEIERSVLCALTAELEIPMKSLPHKIFSYTDLLDFPGARNRFAKPLVEVFKDGEQQMSEMLLRGKVAYLFDNYVMHQEITSMLLCIPDSNMDTIDLPGLIDGWIADTVGTDPALRSEKENILFFVLTKFDKHLTDHAASLGETSRFDRRLESSLHEKFGKLSDKWVEQWTPNKAFDNCYWLRNPNYFVEAIYEYDKSKNETIRVEKQERIAELREGYLQSKNVQTHFRNPEKAWDAAITPNDGGVSFLIEAMTGVCKSDTKMLQIKSQIDSISKNILEQLSPFYVSDEIENRIQQKKQEVAQFVEELEEIQSNEKFGEFISELMVSEELIRGIISQSPPKKSIEISETVKLEQQELEKFKKELYFVIKAIEAWVGELIDFPEKTAMVVGMSHDRASFLVSEIQKSIGRLQLVETIAKQVYSIKFGLVWDKQVSSVSLIIADAINRFVAYLGLDELPVESRPKSICQDGSSIPIFDRPEQLNETVDLPEQPREIGKQYFMHWSTALAYVVEKNVEAESTDSFNREENKRLGKIIESFKQIGES